MKNSGLIFAVCCLMLAAFQSCKKDRTYVVSNPGDQDIIDYSVVLSRSELNGYLADTTATLPVIVKTENGELLPSQCDDVNDDGQWDELAFLCDLEAGEDKIILFALSDTQPGFPIRTNIRFGRMEKPFEEVSGDVRMKTNETRFTVPVYQMEGPAWENDLIGFRNYYDARNGIDIFGKRTKEMILDSVGVNGRDYHTLADWGMDILKVGNTLGAGAIAIAIGDSLYRVGPCEQGEYRLITEGPVRAVLELTYKNVPAGDRLYQVTHQISIHAGDRFFRSKVLINDLQGDEELVTGIVNMHEIPADTLSEDGKNIMFSLGNQGYSGEVLGMGVVIPAGQFKRYWAAPDSGTGIVNTHLVSLNLSKDKPAAYYFVAAWENQDPQVKDKEYFIKLLKEAAVK